MPQDAYLKNTKTNKDCRLNNLTVLKACKNESLYTVYGSISGEYILEDNAVLKNQNGLRLFILDDGMLSTLHEIRAGVIGSVIASQNFDKLSHRTNLASPAMIKIEIR